MKRGRVDVITMGCSKNLVDSQRFMKQLRVRGYDMHHDADDVCGEYVVVNTCGFIGDAKEESINMILSLAEAKSEGRIGQLYVMGCLSERYRKELEQEIPEVTAYFGKFDWEQIVSLLPDRKPVVHKAKPWERVLTGNRHSAYIKISEGCNRFCAYCAIPLITGRHKSRPIDEIIDETRKLVSEGVKEFNVIAQDLSAYGHDIYGRSALAELIDRMADVKGVEWIRLHYAYPVDFPYDVLEVMRRRDNVCKYLDIALQHISDKVLDNMRRHIDREGTMRVIDRIRKEVPGICIRTTLMTGFPGESDEEFAELLDFVKEVKFERMGAFAYCEEEGTYAAIHFDDVIPQDVKEERKDKILAAQREISAELNEQLIGKRLRVLVDSVDTTTKVITARTEWDSPEVDNEVTIVYEGDNAPCNVGDFINVEIIAAYDYDLTAKIL